MTPDPNTTQEETETSEEKTEQTEESLLKASEKEFFDEQTGETYEAGENALDP
jgi:hypothetical protein